MERLMQYVWQHRLFPLGGMQTVDGQRVSVIDQGRLNTASGPDFFNAKIKIGDRLWAGDVEIHVRASDWHRHGHDGDAAYDSVVLHVVERDDAPIRRSNGEVIPQLVLPCSARLGEHYAGLTQLAPGPVLGCKHMIASIPPLYLTDWISSLALERLHQKVDRIFSLMERYQGDWQQAVFVTVARALGFGTNSEPFERLAMSVPLRIMFKHTNSMLAIEALLFGQSGLLERAPGDDPYVERLRSEYQFLSRKYGLRQPEGMCWKMSGMRPGNFPHRRIAMLAAMVGAGFPIAAQLVEEATEEAVARMFAVELSGYWREHYTFGTLATGYTPSTLSAPSIRTLMINVLAPVTMAHGIHHGDTAAIDRAVAILESLPPERNSVVNLFLDAGLKAPDALTTQALIQLRRNYCETRKCLYCRIGHRMLSAHATVPVGG